MIKISKLPAIRKAESFFAVEKILFVDVLLLGKSNGQPPVDHPNVFTFLGKVYLKIVLIGSPEKMFLNVKKGLPFRLSDLVCILYKWDGDLKKALLEGKVYDFSRYHADYLKGRIAFEDEPEFMTETFI